MKTQLTVVLLVCALVEWIFGGKYHMHAYAMLTPSPVIRRRGVNTHHNNVNNGSSDQNLQNHLQAKIDLLVKEIIGLKSKLRSMSGTVHGVETNLRSVRADIKSMKPNLHSNTAHVKGLLENVRSHMKHIKDINSRVHSNSEGVKGLRASMTALEAGIASSRESLVSYSTAELVWQIQQLIGEQQNITKDNLVTTLGTIDKQYKVSFDFNGTKMGSYGNIIHMTSGGDDISKDGDWIPCVYYNGGKLEISSAVNGNGYYYKTASISPNIWHNIEIAQQKVGKQYYYSIRVDDKRIARVVNKKPETYHDIKVYVSDPWYTPQAGYIRNLNIHSMVKKVNKAKSYYTEYKALFLGFGHPASSSYEDKEDSPHTLEECLLVCYTKHEMEKRWSGVRYAALASECYCIKDNQGHITSKSDLHYKFMK